MTSAGHCVKHLPPRQHREDGEEHRNEEGRKSISFHLGERELRQRREMAESPALLALLPSKFCFNALWREAASEGGAEEVRVGRPRGPAHHHL